jgi:hypothetical protein
MRVHQETVDTYLEDIITGSIDQTASVQARHEVREYAEKLNGLVDKIEERYLNNAFFLKYANEDEVAKLNLSALSRIWYYRS